MYEYLIFTGIMLLILFLIINFINNKSQQESQLKRIIPVGTNELIIPCLDGILLTSNTSGQMIRIGGRNTNYKLNKGTNNQIQFFTNNNCVAAFDVSGLLISDTYTMNIGSSTSYLSLGHSSTSSFISSTSSLNLFSGTTNIINIIETGVSVLVPLTISNSLETISINTPIISGNGVVTITNGTITTLEISSTLLGFGNTVQNCINNFSGPNAKIKVGSKSLMNYLFTVILAP